MNVISKTENSREGNDCWINESLYLCEEYDMYFVLKVTKISGWPDHKDISVIGEATESKSRAIRDYKKAGGRYYEVVD